MICPDQIQRSAQPEDLVTKVLQETTPEAITVELVNSPQEEDRWNKLIRKKHYLKEHRMVGESLRYVIKQDGEWIGLLGWSSAAFHLGPRDAWIGWTDAQRHAGGPDLARRFPGRAGEPHLEHVSVPFQAEYGDFSGLGVVHIHQRESLPEQFTLRLEGGNFDSGRAFLAYSPAVDHASAYLAYEGSYTDGPFENPLRYRRDNLNGNFTRTLGAGEKLGFRILYGRNNFYSSGQIPLDLVSAGLLNRFAYIDPTDGGRVWLRADATAQESVIFRTEQCRP